MSKIITPETYYSGLKTTIADWVTATLGLNPSYDDTLQNSIDQWGLPWFRAGAVVHNGAGKILMMHEGRVQVGKLKNKVEKEFHLARGLTKSSWICGDGGWNLPAGRLRSGESFENGAIREVMEESNWDIELKEVIHVRHSEKPNNQYILPVYLAEAIAGPELYRTEETMEIGWFTPKEIQAMFEANLLG